MLTVNLDEFERALRAHINEHMSYLTHEDRELEHHRQQWERYRNITHIYLPDHEPCNHEFVNVSFMQLKLVCKHCNEEQTC